MPLITPACVAASIQGSSTEAPTYVLHQLTRRIFIRETRQLKKRADEGGYTSAAFEIGEDRTMGGDQRNIAEVANADEQSGGARPDDTTHGDEAQHDCLRQERHETSRRRLLENGASITGI
ncbi:hypothetical protein BDZ91DRAFT_797127 [Kalaharituber pfeilii]|nr:hypothetical protein BDZ91DRAFT_797127 [Kalaharituber pfeilii]